MRPGDTLALVGGDADLVLESLALPPHITHNTFVLFPERRTKNYCVSLWEVTRMLITTHFPTVTSARDILNMRTDLCVLFFFNGNDYLPKLKYSTFDRLFTVYERAIRCCLPLLRSLLPSPHLTPPPPPGTSAP